MKLFLYTSR